MTLIDTSPTPRSGAGSGTPSLTVAGPALPDLDRVLTPEALEFLTDLHTRFAGPRNDLLLARQRRRDSFSNGVDPRFSPLTAHIRADQSWKVAGPGPALEDRRVEITGPTDKKMTINALNSGAKVWLADHEDANAPTWSNMIEGQANLYDAIRGQLQYTSPEGKEYKVGDVTPTIVFRPRGWHLTEKHLTYTDRAGQTSSASGSLVDAGLYLFHNAQALIDSGRGPYLYLPKLEGHLEARLWDDVFRFTEAYLGLRHGTIRATVLIETITAAFEMEEILYELRDHCAGLNAGRWDYIFSVIKNFRNRGKRFVLPDRSRVTMTVPFMKAYSELLVQTCHKRGAQAIGGMSAFIPNRREPEVTERALSQVRSDKEREVGQGYDGTWVAHPDLVPVARAVFDEAFGNRVDQRHRLREDVHVEASDLLDIASAGGQEPGAITDAGVHQNVSIGVRYLEAWLRGSGAVALDNLMEDAATAEISRSQIWQWIHQQVVTAEGTPVDAQSVEQVLETVLAELPRFDGDRFDDAASLFREVALGEDFPTFLTVPAYTQFLVERS
ncbi:malate synthase A [Cellulomonas citrea]|uniref:malate synthase A n=1 Tax=Cellulomonas citrea TaxID=1909423 RepID=UPI0013586CE1|nr:malate synthase A [Cellulomonas citrea]